MHKIAPCDQVVKPARWDDDGAALSSVDRCMKLAFFPGRAPRSEAYRDGCRAALEYRYLGKKMPLGYPQGSSEADAWHAGLVEGHSIWRAGDPATRGHPATPEEQQLLMAWRAMDDCARKNMLLAMVAMVENFPRRAPVSLALVPPAQHIRGGPQ